MFKKRYIQVLDSYNTGISTKALMSAFQQVNEIQSLGKQAVQKQLENNEKGRELQKTSEEMALIAKDFQSNADKMKTIQEN